MLCPVQGIRTVSQILIQQLDVGQRVFSTLVHSPKILHVSCRDRHKLKFIVLEMSNHMILF